MAFINDTFTEASDINLASHTGELGASWTDHPHANYTTSIAIDAATDRIFSTGTAAYYASGVPPSADYSVEADFYLHSAISQNIAICARMDTTDDTMVIVRLNNGTIYDLREIVTGTAGTLGSTTNQIPSVGTSKRVRLVVQGNQASVYINDVLEIGPVTITITAAGRAGVRNAGTASATTGIHLDNLSASELGANLGVSLFRGRNFPFFDDEEVNRFEFWPAVAAGPQSYTLTTTAGVFNLTGNAAGLTEQKKITAATGTFTETGNASNLLFGRKASVTAGAFNLTGSATTFQRIRIMPVTVGSFTLTGQAANLIEAKRIAAGIGAFNLTGNTATLTKSSELTLSVSAGAFTLTGNAATLRETHILTAQLGTYTLAGNATELQQAHLLTAQNGAFALAGQTANFNVVRTISVTTGAFVSTWNDAGIRATRILPAGLGAFTLTGPDVLLLIGTASTPVIGPLNVNLINSGNLGTSISLGTTATSINDGRTGVEL